VLALIAGQGRLPAHLAERLTAQGRRFLICELEGFPPPATGAEKITFRIEHLGSLLQTLRQRGVTTVCLAGAIRRPAVDPAAIDAATAPLAPRIARAIASGDDAALRIILSIFEEHGFTISAAHHLAPELLPPPGIPTTARPLPRHHADAARADAALAALGAADIGQACIIADGEIVATEGPAGTDAMLAVTTAPGGLLAKAPKPAQDRRADLPTIGPQTATAAARPGLAGIVIAADGVMVLEMPEVIARCNAAGLFLWIRTPEEAEPCAPS